MRILVTYDIVTNRRRRRLAKRLDGVIDRVQKSVFEGEVDGGTIERIRKVCADTIDKRTDDVRIYRLCARCLDTIEIIGKSPAVPREKEDVVL